jgi:NAD+ synthase (glutamine-hydrolysing)
MKIAVAQINTTIGDFEGNARKILDGLKWAESQGADLVAFPELAVCGYPPRDLLEKPTFVRRNLECVESIAQKTKKTAAVLGYVSTNETAEGRGLFNTAGILHEGKVKFVQHKTLLPSYDVFDEGRHFEPARKHGVCHIAGKKVALSLCEDMWSWHEFEGRRLYRHDPMERLIGAGAELILNLSASPFTLGKHAVRRQLVSAAAARFEVPVVFCNLVGGNDELVFDGRSMVADKQGRIVWEAKGFVEDSFVVDMERIKPAPPEQTPSEEEEVRRALVLGLRDYMRKCGFDKAVVGISGGIDSAVVAAIACEAIGDRKLMGVLLPSPYSSEESVQDAERLAANLGIVTCEVRIDDIYDVYRKALGFSEDREVSIAEENIQARIRGGILMAISNREGAIVISTGNKSELSVGYCTLYGDMAGGFALISDVLKTMVYALARHINKEREVIPRSILEKPPSAELKPDQMDQDALPPYEVLDPIIKAYIEEKQSAEAIVAMGFDREVVEQVVKMIDCNEYKRRQAPPGIKITPKAFGSGRRFPIAWKP